MASEVLKLIFAVLHVSFNSGAYIIKRVFCTSTFLMGGRATYAWLRQTDIFSLCWLMANFLVHFVQIRPAAILCVLRQALPYNLP